MPVSTKFLCEGALLRCDKSAGVQPLQVASNKKFWIRNKKVATVADTTIQPFGNCALLNNATCSPQIQKWKGFQSNVFQGSNELLLESSELLCAPGGGIGKITKT